MRVESTNRISSLGRIKLISSVEEKPTVSFLDTVKSVANINNLTQIKVSSNQKYNDPYQVEISQKDMEYLELYKDNTYPIINQDIFVYTNDLRIIYKGY